MQSASRGIGTASRCKAALNLAAVPLGEEGHDGVHPSLVHKFISPILIISQSEKIRVFFFTLESMLKSMKLR
jgi:hypothetical protein